MASVGIVDRVLRYPPRWNNGGEVGLQAPLLLLPPDQETGICGVDRDEPAMFVAGRAELFARPSDDVFVLIPDECFKRARVPRCDRANDSAAAVPNELLF
jgi:hypothetical protein